MDNAELLEEANEFLDEMSLGGLGKAAVGAGRAMTRGAAGGLGSIGKMAGRAGKAIAGGVRGMAGNAGAMAQKAGGAGMRAPMRPGVAGGGARSAMRPGGLGRSLTSDIETPLERANRFLYEVSLMEKVTMAPVRRAMRPIKGHIKTAIKHPIKTRRNYRKWQGKMWQKTEKILNAPQNVARAIGGY